MALNPDEIVSEGWWTLPDDPPSGFQLPEGFVLGNSSGQVYAYQRTYKDGRRVVQWFKRGAGGGPAGPDGKPGDAVALEQSVVHKPTKDKWEADVKEESKTPTTRTINGVPHQVTGKDANGQDIWSPVQTAAGPATAKTGPSGPPGGAAWKDDDEKQGKNGRRWGWNPDTKAYDRDLGSSPAAQEITRNEAAGRGAKTDAQLEQEQKDAPKPVTTFTTINGQPGYRTVVTPGKNGGKPTVEHFDPSGAPIPQLPASREATQPTREEKPYQHDDGQTYTQVTETDPVKGTKRTFYRDKDGKEVVLPPKGQLKLPEGSPAVDLSSAETAYSSTMQYWSWLDAQFRAGKLTAQQVKDAYEPAHRQAEVVINREKDRRTQEQQATANRLTERNQDITQSGQRLTNATSQFSTALAEAGRVGQLADPGQGAAAHTLLGTLALQALYANQQGGMATPGPVVPGPVANLPQYTPPGVQAAAAGPTSAEKAAGIMANPVFRPMPIAAPAASPAAVSVPPVPSAAGVPTTVPAPIAPAPMPARPPVRDDWRHTESGVPVPFNTDPNQGAVGMVGAPVMAVAGSYEGGDPYAEARAALKRAGLSDATIEAAYGGFVRGAA